MLPPTPSAILLNAVQSLPELIPTLGVWLAMLGFGAYHGLNPGMGWLFALSLGLQQRSARAIWRALAPIALGHAGALALVAGLVLAGAQFISVNMAQALTAVLLVGFGLYKIFNYYRHPRWVGMRVGTRDLLWWSFLMATAHGAGLMIIPALLGIVDRQSDLGYPAEHTHLAAGGSMAVAITVHTAAMLVVMAVVAWVIYKWVGLAVLRTRWVNFDLVWAIALLVVGVIAAVGLVGDLALPAQATEISHLH